MSFNLQEECQLLQQDVLNYSIPRDHDVRNMDRAAVIDLLEDMFDEVAVESISQSSDAIIDEEVFDTYRSLLKGLDTLPNTALNKLLDSITSGLLSEVESTQRTLDSPEEASSVAEHKKPLEYYAFLLQWFVLSADKVSEAQKAQAPPSPAPGKRKGAGPKGKKKAPTGGGIDDGSGPWTWEPHISHTLAVISKVLRLKTHRVWVTAPERDAFINCITRPAYYITESEVYMKSNDIRLGVYKVICLAVKHHGHGFGAQISIMQCLQYYEHLPEPMAEALTVLAKEFDYTQLAEEILREIAGKQFGGQDTKGPRSFSRFLVRLGELSPRIVLKQISLLLTHLDSESYPMRMALVEIVGMLIREIAMSDEGEQEQEAREKKISNLFELLMERFLDVSSYVRAKVINTLSRLCDLPVKFPKQRLVATELTVASLEDKASSVRRYAIALLTKLVLTHPYGLMHGGLLRLEEWEARYAAVSKELKEVESKAVEGGIADEEDGESENNDRMEEDAAADDNRSEPETQSNNDANEEESRTGTPTDEREDEDATPKKKVSKQKKKSKRKSEGPALEALTNEQAALAALESNHILHLKLRKRYYAEGLDFIKRIESGMEIMTQLLGSKNKPEVLEAVDFFKVAHDYQFASAEVGIKKMLHLIWSKDNNSTTEDGMELKGIRSRLIECYRSLYFDPLPDMEPKQQVNRIARNMIELTYDATLAELTSLEELIRTMTDDGQIHSDVIAKLWQVYGSEKQLPKNQRRGAIIILGMLAVAKRHIVSDRVDVLLKVGLGPLGKTDLTLSRYTCIALQRLNGSVKNVKGKWYLSVYCLSGSLLDKSVRLPMDNPIFRKLQDMIEHPCRSKDWFGMAEQAINTIYLLGEHPDRLCNELIKNLAQRAFGRAAIPSQPQISSQAQKDDEDLMEDVIEESEALQLEDKSNLSFTTARNSQTPALSVGSQRSLAQTPAPTDLGDAFHLSQLIFVVGHVAIKHIVYLEMVEKECKRQKEEKEKEEKSKNKAKKSGSKENGEELDQVAGNAEDEIGERIAAVRETELLYGSESLLALFGPMIIHICGSPHRFKNQLLRTTATLSFSKFLCVSSQFCDQHHRLLFKILETSNDPNVRSNIVIALGDVAVSFSNIFDENSDALYKGLSDRDMVVKKNTLMVLTHLILNGMIKVKGQLGEMAKCLEDTDTRIADLARLFFTELSTKDNAIYNNLPDGIAHFNHNTVDSP
ncbi:hypothetical protein Clacol_009273 [Clathrus columnatus]|uniref:Condensin complex subunit 1 n=1 Tax=Clathrus columnatus TaxID=1419009 RepID=A0AAV5AK13_9AGAM|nr:hypothetical protein Clacol_009273 [Clathrus columnatus]